MFENRCDDPAPQFSGLFFKIGSLDNLIPDSLGGAWVEESVYLKTPVMRERTIAGVVYKFYMDPIHGPTRLLRAGLPDGSETIGLECRINVSAEVIDAAEALAELIEQAITTKDDPPALLAFMEGMLNDGLNLSCEFVEILRQRMNQYWFRPPDPASWIMVTHYSKARGKWCTFMVPDEMRSKVGPRRRGSQLHEFWQRHLILKRIEEGDVGLLQKLEHVSKTSFPEEMVATALVELHRGRFRSAIVHAVIGYEIAAKRGLDILLKTRLSGLDSGAIVEAITRQVNTATLGRLVLWHAEKKETPPDWTKIEALYDTRNKIMHLGQKRMPPYDEIKNQVLEVLTFVRCLEKAMYFPGTDAGMDSEGYTCES
jgi:hypothetical protein